MKVIQIQTLSRQSGEPLLSPTTYVAQSVGDALDMHAPDPSEGATFRVHVLTAATVVAS